MPSLLLVLLRRRLGPIGIGLLASTLVRITVASAVMGVAAWGLHDWLATSVLVGNGLLPQVIRVGGCIGVALLVLVVHGPTAAGRGVRRGARQTAAPLARAPTARDARD